MDPYGSPSPCPFELGPAAMLWPEDCPAGQINIEEWTGPDLTEYNELATKRIPQPNCVLANFKVGCLL